MAEEWVQMRNAAGGLSLAPFAANPAESRGRKSAEEESRSRTSHQRDRDRVIHSTAFRRLKHKTQVFVYHEGDHYRTRLTHSLEVAQIARSIARSLCLNEDLTEALALAHDLGHTPFGHAGEEALSEEMAPFGGFDHNVQTLRIVTKLEQRYADFDGLNLTWETLEGLCKHNGPLGSKTGSPDGGYLEAFVTEYDMAASTYASMEAQVAALSDDIAYNNHDIDDGLRADLITLEQLSELGLVGDLIREVKGRHPQLERRRLIHEVNRRLITALVSDLIKETRLRLDRYQPTSSEDVRNAQTQMVDFSESMKAEDKKLKKFLYANLYRHPQVTATMDRAGTVLRDLFRHFSENIDELPEERRALIQETEGRSTSRVLADYIAGMTDRFALKEHTRIFKQELAL